MMAVFYNVIWMSDKIGVKRVIFSLDERVENLSFGEEGCSFKLIKK
jgi:hypothetical protein